MAGKHRKPSQIQTEVARRGGTGLAAAALSVTGLSTAVVTGTTAAVAPNLQLMALVSAANSTSQFFAGSSYYGTDWKDVYGGQQDVVPFYKGPQGIADEIQDVQVGGKQTGVTASGWGAGQTGTALGIINENNPALLNSIGLVILDNNSNRAGGGFWTTYYPFAPLLFTSADPSPNNLPVTVLDVAYEYNINSDAPVDPLNPFALGNSLAAYAFGYGEESRTLNITQDPNGTLVYTDPENNTTDLQPGYHYVVNSDGTIAGATKLPPNPDGSAVTTTYVTVDSGDLPLTRPLRLIPGGDIIADAVDPTLTKLVDAGYNDGKGTATDPAIPANPAVTRPMKPFSSLSALDGDDLQDAAQQGAGEGATTAIADVTHPSNLITKPLAEASKLPGISSLTNAISSLNTPSTQNTLTSGANKATPNNAKSGGSSSAGNSKPLKQFSERVSDAVNKVTGGLKKEKPSTDNNDE